MLAYSVGEGAGSFSLDGKREVSLAQSVGKVIWVNNEGGDTFGVQISGIDQGFVERPGNISVQYHSRFVLTGGGLEPDYKALLNRGTQTVEMLTDATGERSVPIQVRRMDDTGGEAFIDLAGNKEELSVWKRDIAWDAAGQVRIEDTMVTHLGTRQAFKVLWLLPTKGPVEVTQSRSRTIVEAPDVTLVIQADSSIRVESDAPLAEAQWGNGGGIGQLLNQPSVADYNDLTITCVEPQASLKLVTRIIPKDREGPQN